MAKKIVGFNKMPFLFPRSEESKEKPEERKLKVVICHISYQVKGKETAKTEHTVSATTRTLQFVSRTQSASTAGDIGWQ